MIVGSVYVIVREMRRREIFGKPAPGSSRHRPHLPLIALACESQKRLVVLVATLILAGCTAHQEETRTRLPPHGKYENWPAYMEGEVTPPAGVTQKQNSCLWETIYSRFNDKDRWKLDLMARGMVDMRESEFHDILARNNDSVARARATCGISS